MAQKPVMEFKVLGKRTRTETIISDQDRWREENKHCLSGLQMYCHEAEYMDDMEGTQFDESSMKKQKRRSKNDF